MQEDLQKRLYDENATVIRDEKVALLYTPQQGAGWYSRHGVNGLLFDPKVVEFVEAENFSAIEAYVNEAYAEESVDSSKANELAIAWIPVNAEFEIREEDGAETILYKESDVWKEA